MNVCRCFCTDLGLAQAHMGRNACREATANRLDLRRTANLAAYAFAAYRNPIGILSASYIRDEGGDDSTTIVHPLLSKISDHDKHAQSALAPTSGKQSEQDQKDRSEAFRKAWEAMRGAESGVLQEIRDDPICNLNNVTFIEQPSHNTQVWMWSDIGSTNIGHVCTSSRV